VIGERVAIGRGALIDAGFVEIGADTSIGEDVLVRARRFTIGELGQIGASCRFFCRDFVAGDVVTLRWNVAVVDGQGGIHDCRVGDGVIMANNATLGGHVEVQDHAYLGGLCAVHQFVRIGQQAMIGGLAGVEQDVIPYGAVLGNRAYLNGLNIIGMRRRGISREEIQHLRTAYRLLFAPEGAFSERLAEVAGLFASHPRIMEIIDFIGSAGSRAICMPRQNRVG